ncbi:M28 family peptidase [Pararhodonellum marinum]|uniref:M28 family peptidase n=1 Tax=Pararhodonellum marinum TaxID=2755358 RepID=UPI00188EB754|nr:M28 family peptidase [Pararhodonellum marinum]
MRNRIWLCLILGTFLYACGGRERAEETAVPIDYKDVPAFNADSAYAFIQKQVDFGPRVPNTAGHEATKNWLIEKLKGYKLEVQTQEFSEKTYDGQLWDLTNIIASYKPDAKKRILLAAHWDSRRIADKDSERLHEPIEGANDGGSGVGVLLEIARVLAYENPKPDVGIDFIFFDGEDDGEPEHQDTRNRAREYWWCLGSQYWSTNLHERGYSAYFGILVDMVGGRGARFYKEGYSVRYAKNIVNKVWNYGHELGHSDFFQMRETAELVDDHLFVNKNAGIPMINIIEFSPDYGFGHYHHTHADNMDMIDKRTLKAVGETVLFTIYQE